MSTRTSKRKAKRTPVNNENGEIDSNSRAETESILSEQDFSEITKKVENTLSKKVKETSDSQKEMMKILMEMKDQIAIINGRENINPIELRNNTVASSFNEQGTSNPLRQILDENLTHGSIQSENNNENTTLRESRNSSGGFFFWVFFLWLKFN